MIAAQVVENTEKSSDVKLVSLPKPVAKPGDVVVKIHSSAINPVDFLTLSGYVKNFGWTNPLPYTPGYDISGVVESVGEGVTEFQVGDEVFAVNWGQGKHNDANDDIIIGGGFAEFVSIPASRFTVKPSDVSHDTAAAVALVGTTALGILNTVGVNENSKILVVGGAGSVGSLVTQLAKLRGAYVAVTASTRTLEFTKQFGADLIINYNNQSWWLESSTGVTGYDFILDAVGEADAWAHAQTEGLLKQGGSYVTISSPDAGFDPAGHQPRFSWAALFTLAHNADYQTELINLVKEGKLNVVIDEVFPFTQEGVVGIFDKIKGGKSMGKSVLRIV